MKRGSPLKRTGFKRRTSTLAGWNRSVSSGKRKALPARSEKRATLYKEERVPLVLNLLRDRPLCEACPVFAAAERRVTYQRRPSDDVHEVLSRARGGSVVQEDNLACVCRQCHQRLTRNPTLAECLGLAVSRHPTYGEGETDPNLLWAARVREGEIPPQPPPWRLDPKWRFDAERQLAALRAIGPT